MDRRDGQIQHTDRWVESQLDALGPLVSELSFACGGWDVDDVNETYELIGNRAAEGMKYSK